MNRKADVSADRGKRKGLHQMDCYGSAISPSLLAVVIFFPWLLGLFLSAELCSSD